MLASFQSKNVKISVCAEFCLSSKLHTFSFLYFIGLEPMYIGNEHIKSNRLVFSS